MKIVLIGIQGSGKSTQGNLLAEKLKVPYLSTGYLIPDEKTLEIVSDYLSRPEYQKGYILDGFPRTKVQAESFKNGIDAVLYIKVLDEEAIRRLSLRRDNREDEAPRALKKRIESFHKFTIPVLEYYKEKGKLHEINGERTIEEIHRDICGILGVASNGQ